jgi:hypothetical protein
MIFCARTSWYMCCRSGSPIAFAAGRRAQSARTRAFLDFLIEYNDRVQLLCQHNSSWDL